ncbi:MAG: hypothetical protein CL933_17930 [Deltaproteobacteria bacterium]|nr:hypothetical protein [Deltaproteobacteria bacterium]
MAYTGWVGPVERIEQCGDRTVVTSSGVIHDFHTDGTLANGARDIEPPDCANTYVSIDFDEKGVMNFHPFDLSLTIVTRRMEGDEFVWAYPRVGGGDPHAAHLSDTRERKWLECRADPWLKRSVFGSLNRIRRFRFSGVCPSGLVRSYVAQQTPGVDPESFLQCIRGVVVPRRFATRLARAGTICVLGIGLACEGAIDADRAGGGAAGEDAPILATVDGKPITAEATDTPLRLELHDLDQAKYRARRERLESLIADRLGAGVTRNSAEWRRRVEFYLVAPPPPRFEIPGEGAWVRGDEGAPVTIVEFLDLASPHSRRLQPVLIRLLGRYPDRVRVQVRDLPLPYHRNARRAALAAHCAGEQGAYWDFQDAILLEQPALTPSDQARYALSLGLDPDLFGSCVDSGRHSVRVDRDLSLAASLGVRRAATIFVNGLYLSGHPSYDEIDRVVRKELVRLGLDPNPSDPPLQSASDVNSRAFDARQSAARTARRAALPRIPPEELAEPEAVLTLTRAEVDLALKDRRGLDRKLEASRAEFSGQRLLSLRQVTEGDFYARLGLQERDVLMVVNGEFLTVEHNWIWDAFETQAEITLLIMRRGRPHTFAYRIR